MKSCSAMWSRPVRSTASDAGAGREETASVAALAPLVTAWSVGAVGTHGVDAVCPSSATELFLVSGAGHVTVCSQSVSAVFVGAEAPCTELCPKVSESSCFAGVPTFLECQLAVAFNGHRCHRTVTLISEAADKLISKTTFVVIQRSRVSIFLVFHIRCKASFVRCVSILVQQLQLLSGIVRSVVQRIAQRHASTHQQHDGCCCHWEFHNALVYRTVRI
jgi:hypothetical protein